MTCPFCGAFWQMVADITRNVRPRSVQPGDFGLCASCGGFLIVVTPDEVRAMTDGEWLALPQNVRIDLTTARDEDR